MVFFYPLIVNRLNQSWIRNPKPFQLTYFPFYCHMLLYFLHFSTYHSSHIISNACEFSNHLRIEFGVVIWQRTQFLFSCNKSNYSLFWRKKEGSWSRKMKENNGMYFFLPKKRSESSSLWIALPSRQLLQRVFRMAKSIVSIRFHVT